MCPFDVLRLRARVCVGSCLFSKFRFAQVPCKNIILHARSSSSTSAGVKDLAAISLGHSETGVHKVLANHGCKLEVPTRFIDLPSQGNLPYVRMTDWVRFLVQTGRLQHLVGTSCKAKRRALCLEFWQRLEKLRPQLPVYEMHRQKKLDLADTIPVLHHGDEGTTYKKCAIMVLSTHGVLGSGCSQAKDRNKKKYPIHRDPMRLNFIGSTVTNHFIFTALPHTKYKETPEVLDSMLSLYAADMANLATQGVTARSQDGEDEHLWVVCIAAKGDLPYLGKAGHFCRSFSKCPKHATSAKHSAGICYMCLGGIEGRDQAFPWEDFSMGAAWLSTRGQEPGFSVTGPLLSMPNDNGYEFYRPDIWHCFHLGCAKTFLASSLVVLIESMEGMNSVEEKLSYFSKDYKRFCRQNKKYGYITAITRDLLGWESSKDMPAGHWSKGHLSTRLMEWLQDYLQRFHLNDMRKHIQDIVPCPFQHNFLLFV